MEERQKEKTGEEGGQQGRVLVCGKQHTQCMCLASHTQREDKTRHGNGDTHMGMDDTTRHTGGKGREKTRGGTREDTQALLFSKMKKRRKDNEEWLKTMKA